VLNIYLSTTFSKNHKQIYVSVKVRILVNLLVKTHNAIMIYKFNWIILEN